MFAAVLERLVYPTDTSYCRASISRQDEFFPRYIVTLSHSVSHQHTHAPGVSANMHATTHILLFLSITFAPLVAADPLLDDLTPPTNLTRPSSLKWDPILPWGPEDFDVDVNHETVPIPRDAIFVTTIRFIAEQAAEDFYRRLPRPSIVFSDPNYPSVSIAVSSPGPRQVMERKYVLWGMARILNRMIERNAFRGSIYTLRWRGAVVGRILFVAAGRDALDTGLRDVAITQPRLEIPSPQQMSNNTQLSMGEGSNAMSYNFEFWGELLVKQDVFMSTLGGLIQVAQHASHTFDFWVGSFPGYRCFHVYHTSVQPSVMTKNLVIATMVAGMVYALRQDNWHELRLIVTKDGQAILSGGYMDHPLLPDQQSVSSL